LSLLDVLRLRNPTTTVSVAGVRQFSMRTHSRRDDFISTSIREQGRWEPFETTIVLSLLRSGLTFYDVGANIGWFTVIAGLAVGATGTVLSFEPDEANFRLLQINVRKNELHNVQSFNAGVSDRDGTGTLFLSATNRGDHQLDSPDPTRNASRVRVMTLSGLLRTGAPCPDLIKFDTQGSEAKILSDLVTGTAGKIRCPIVLEFWPHGLARSGSTPGAMLDLLARLEPDLFIVDEVNRALHPISIDDLRWRAENDLAPQTVHFTNLLCFPRGGPPPQQLRVHVVAPWDRQKGSGEFLGY
jgi:FkbM family methyltransferase